ncbi:hypothetical protein [Teredinibacter turnerae]|uniref:hypothetical protein n=1 Tax=Teredinibacter turnerae TaxID=2426 RepID=UPI0003621F47|nr:hypothetical protein [Teredinibacter turnerae]
MLRSLAILFAGLLLSSAVLAEVPPTRFDVKPKHLGSFDAPGVVIAELDEQGYLARIDLNSPSDVESALLRAESWFRSGKLASGQPPLAFVIHGPEVAIFFRENYEKYRPIVDLAAKLSAFEVVNVRVCETSTSDLGHAVGHLQPFVDTVPFGPAEIERLVNEEKYLYF